MRLLVLDCAANACAAAILDDDRDLAALSEPMMRGHAERIAPMLADCFAAAAMEADALDAVAVTVGPGLSLCLEVGVRKAVALTRAHQLRLVRTHHMQTNGKTCNVVLNDNF